MAFLFLRDVYISQVKRFSRGCVGWEDDFSFGDLAKPSIAKCSISFLMIPFLPGKSLSKPSSPLAKIEF